MSFISEIKKKPAWLLAALFLLTDAYILTFAFGRNTGEKLSVAFLDVGQGDAIFVESPTGRQILIDAGEGALVLPPLAKVMPFYDKSLDALIGTHPDKDHIGGIPYVLEKYDVSYFLEPGLYRETSLQDEIYKLTGEKKIIRKNLRRGDILNLGGGAYMEVLFPDRDAENFESNAASVGIRLSYGKTSFILTGDMPANVEEYLSDIETGELRASVLKAGHHGSKTSTSNAFLADVVPEYVVISAGKNNRYGHPNKEVLDKLQAVGTKTLKTYESGTIVFKSDGKTLKVLYK